MERKTEQVDVRDLRTYGASRAVRHPDCDYRGNIDIHVTIRAAGGDPFREDRVARLVTENVEHYCALLDYRLYGYCLMPDHLHLLLSPSENGPPLGEWLKRFKGFTSREFSMAGGTPPLWQRSAHDHICRQGETAERVLGYIVNNPVRAGLVEDWMAWPWTGVIIDL